MSKTKPTVTVLLATYNGERYIKQQIESVINQINVEVELYVLDVGSTDKTLEFIHEYIDRGTSVEIFRSEKVRPTTAFLALLAKCNEKEFVAFCDQDDIWDGSKLEILVGVMSGQGPEMAFSDRLYISHSGQKIGKSRKLRYAPDYRNALIENVAPGNTILLNREAVKLLNKLDVQDIIHYDSWIYLVLSFFGKCLYVNRPLVHYRIHSENTVGIQNRKVQSILVSVQGFICQAQSLYRSCELKKLDDYKLMVLRDFLATAEQQRKFPRLLKAFNLNVQRQRLIETIVFKFILAFSPIWFSRRLGVKQFE